MSNTTHTSRYKKQRISLNIDLATEFSLLSLSPRERMARRFEYMCSAEEPVIADGERIVFTRTVENLPDIFTTEEMKEIRSKYYIHELGYRSNIAPDYEGMLSKGLGFIRESADECAKREIDALLGLVQKYRALAIAQGRTDIAETLAQVPENPPRSFYEALQFFRIMHFAFWLEGNYHNTVGRFDKYMFPYLKKDLKSGAITVSEAEELVTELFASFNRDSDTYVGVQQGDNGQSLMLGGVDKSGFPVWNELSRICLRASAKNKMIDPKINIRVSKETPIDVYELGSRLTRVGLGFPQYSNDDVVIPALTKLGYSLEDARDYTVAACWEFIIPKYGADIPNIGAMSYPKAVDVALRADRPYNSYEDFERAVMEEIRDSVENIIIDVGTPWFIPSPLLECFIEERYHNFGIHGTGLSTAADSLAAIRKYVFENKMITFSALKEAVLQNFEGKERLLHILRNAAPKLGQSAGVREISERLMLGFAESLNGKRNSLGGIYRGGTGSAMYYLWHSAEIGASPDGRKAGEPFGANFSPSLFAKTGGPFSVINDFTSSAISSLINGGPLTMEFAASSLSDDESVKKLAMLVKYFITRGGHQLQLNAIDSDKLREAQSHPEEYRNLIVRIWGWSAYFTELDREYQDHVIMRQEYGV